MSNKLASILTDSTSHWRWLISRRDKNRSRVAGRVARRTDAESHSLRIPLFAASTPSPTRPIDSRTNDVGSGIRMKVAVIPVESLK
jgi:hypothetical protein